jgi:serpin B
MPACVISPASLLSAFGVLSLAEDETVRKELAKLFGDRQSNVAAATAATTTVGSCSSIWLKAGTVETPELTAFVRAARREFGATVEIGIVAARINAWISECTKGMIPTVVDDSVNSASVAIVNALAFDCKWKHPFDSGLSIDGHEFFRTPSDAMTCRMMRDPKVTLNAIFAPEGFGALLELESPSEDHSMSILVASRNDGAIPSESFVRRVSEDSIIEDVDLSLPVTFASFGPKDVLGDIAALGARSMKIPGHIAFNRDLFVSDVFHCAKLKFDEKGAKGAAATVVMMREAAVAPGRVKPKKMVFDHPFFVGVVVHRKWERIPATFAFVAFVRDPTSEKW